MKVLYKTKDGKGERVQVQTAHFMGERDPEVVECALDIARTLIQENTPESLAQAHHVIAELEPLDGIMWWFGVLERAVEPVKVSW